MKGVLSKNLQVSLEIEIIGPRVHFVEVYIDRDPGDVGLSIHTQVRNDLLFSHHRCSDWPCRRRHWSHHGCYLGGVTVNLLSPRFSGNVPPPGRKTWAPASAAAAASSSESSSSELLLLCEGNLKQNHHCRPTYWYYFLSVGLITVLFSVV